MATSFYTEIESPEMETLSSLAEGVVFRVPGCSNAMVRKVLQNTYSDFCNRSLALKRHVEIPVMPGMMAYRVPHHSGHKIVSVVDISMSDGGRVVRHPKLAYVKCDRVISVPRQIMPIGLSHAHINATVVESPVPGFEDAPRWFIDQYGDAIISGVCAYLFAMQNRPWTDQAQAMTERINYENAVSEARFAHHEETGVVGGPCPEEIL